MNQTTDETIVEQSLLSNNLQQRDRTMLQDVAHRLLAHGSLLRSRASERPLYDWSIEHQPWLEEWAALLGLKIIIQRDERLIMAIPEVPSLTRKLKRDETLVALALWYDFDVEVRENGAHDVYFHVRDFNEQFQSKFPSIQPLSQSRLKEILRRFVRFNLIEMDWEEDFTDSVIQILPTLRFAIPFPDIEQWLKVASAFNADVPSDEESEDDQEAALQDDEVEDTNNDSSPSNKDEQDTSPNNDDDEGDEDEDHDDPDSEDEDDDDEDETGLLDGDEDDDEVELLGDPGDDDPLD